MLLYNEIHYGMLSLYHIFIIMQENISIIDQVIRNRRSIFPNTYIDREISVKTIKEILDCAIYAPTHRLTQPWRFKVMRGNALQRLSDYLGKYYEEHTPADNFSPMKLEKTRKKPLQSSCVIAICMQRDPKESVPEWEEIASVAMAVQNMWLAASAREIGAYWSSPIAALKADEFLALGTGEKCLGLFYMGYHHPMELQANRSPISEKVEWMD